MLEKLTKEETLGEEEALKALDSFCAKYEPFLEVKFASIGIRKDARFGYYLGVTPTIEKIWLFELPDYWAGVPVLLREAEDIAIAEKL